MIMKQSKERFDFKAFGQAIKAARKAKGISRNQLADTLNIAPRYIASIENSGPVSYTHLDVYKRQGSHYLGENPSKICGRGTSTL